jgi:hypothetical protein
MHGEGAVMVTTKSQRHVWCRAAHKHRLESVDARVRQSDTWSRPLEELVRGYVESSPVLYKSFSLLMSRPIDAH